MGFISKFIDEASAVIGCPYIWGGNGDTIWTPEGMKDVATHLGPNPYGPELAFDCVGLVKYALKKAGGPDITATHNAQTIWDEVVKPDWSGPQLLFYGADTSRIIHIAIDICDWGNAHGEAPRLVLEAAGGGHLTSTWEAAKAAGAHVRFGRQLRSDYVGSAPLLGLLSLGKQQ